MLRIDRYRTLFFHTPKTGGTAIRDFFCESLKLKRPNPGHQPAAAVRTAYPEVFDSYFKFAFVRNPLERLVSSFFYLHQGGRNERDRMRYERFFAKYDGDFRRFVLDLENNPHLVDPPAEYLKDEESGVPFESLHFVSQWYWICDSGGVTLVDFIGRYENFEEDLDRACRNFGIRPGRLPRSNASNHLDYRLHYDEETAEIVRKLYRKDFELFGY